MSDTIQQMIDHYRTNPNPVEVAGYGRESTHKGYLTWILNRDSRGMAIKFLCELINNLGDRQEKKWLSGIQSIHTEYEKRLGKRKIDLIVTAKTSERKIKIPIELKTDSDPDPKQLEDYLKECRDKPDEYGPVVLMLLGSSSVHRVFSDYEAKKFKDLLIIRPEDIIKASEVIINDGFQPFKDWIDAIKLEIERRKMAGDALTDYVQTHDPNKTDRFWLCGYRSLKHVYYYFYYHLKNFFDKNLGDYGWNIYDGGYNAVMNFDKNNWYPIALKTDDPSLENIGWFFEFNDSHFVMKIRNPYIKENACKDEIRNEINSLQTKMKSVDCSLKPVYPKGNRCSYMWLTIARWDVIEPALKSESNLDLAIESITNSVKTILNSFGPMSKFGKDISLFDESGKMKQVIIEDNE